MNIIVFLLFILLVVSMWLFPTAMLALGIASLLFSLAIAISSIFEKHKSACAQGKITQEFMRRKIGKDIVVLIITIALVLVLGGMAGRYVASYAGALVESRWQGLGMIAGFIAAIAVSFGVGFGVRWGIGKMNKLI